VAVLGEPLHLVQAERQTLAVEAAVVLEQVAATAVPASSSSAIWAHSAALVAR
jgi:hypothetical protein